MPKSLVLCEGPKSARDCEQISKLLVEKRLTNANSDAPSEVHQLSVATCQSAAGRESIFGECRSRAAYYKCQRIKYSTRLLAILVPSASFFNKASEMKPVDLDDKLKGTNSEKLVNQN